MPLDPERSEPEEAEVRSPEPPNRPGRMEVSEAKPSDLPSGASPQGATGSRRRGRRQPSQAEWRKQRGQPKPTHDFLELDFLNVSQLTEAVLEWTQARSSHVLGLAEHRTPHEKEEATKKELRRQKWRPSWSQAQSTGEDQRAFSCGVACAARPGLVQCDLQDIEGIPSHLKNNPRYTAKQIVLEEFSLLVVILYLPTGAGPEGCESIIAELQELIELVGGEFILVGD